MTPLERSTAQLTQLCRDAGLSDKADSMLALFRALADDDATFELFVDCGGRGPELRFVVDIDGQSARDRWPRLRGELRVDLERLALVEPLFAPQKGERARIRHALSFAPGRAPEFAVELDSQVHGRWRAAAVTEEALCRLGFTRAWPIVTTGGDRGLELDEIVGLSLDMSAAPGRVEVVRRHHRATALDAARSAGEPRAPRAEAVELCRALDGSDGPYLAHPLVSRTALIDPRADRAAWRTIGMPVAARACSDAGAAARIAHYLSRHELAAAPRVALAPRAGVAVAQAPSAPLPAEEIVRRYEHDILLANHPFLSRLRREPVHLGHLWIILANFWEAIVHDFPGRLARVIANLDDDRLRSIFVKQLNDELGEGDYSRAHKAMFRTLVDAVEPHRPAGDLDILLAPGRRFGRALEERLFSRDYHEAVGALMMIEVYGKQTDLRLGEEFRRQRELEGEPLTWLRLHEELEVDHADDSLRLAHILPRPEDGAAARATLEQIWRGAVGVVDAGHAYFDDLYRVCYAPPLG